MLKVIYKNNFFDIPKECIQKSKLLKILDESKDESKDDESKDAESKDIDFSDSPICNITPIINFLLYPLYVEIPEFKNLKSYRLSKYAPWAIDYVEENKIYFQEPLIYNTIKDAMYFNIPVLFTICMCELKLILIKKGI